MFKLTQRLSLLVLLIACTVGHTWAQYTPTHPKYVTYITGDKSFAEYFPTWEPGKALSEDENFFISRVKIKERFVNRNTQVIPSNENNNQRKMSMCVPMGISDTYWQTLPRYVMDGDNFGMWSYIDSQGGWSQPWIRTVGAYSDVCHKNGVANSGGVMFIDATAGSQSSGPQQVIDMLITKNSDGSFKYLDKFMKFLRYYGVDGLTFNPEGTIRNASTFQDFLAACHEKAAELGTQFHVYWYGANNNSGNLDLGSSLTSSKSNWFIKNGKDVADVYFLNYDWHMSVPTSTSTAERLRKGSTNNLYAGYDIQGNWLARGNWQTLKDSKMSIIFWGNHTTNMIYQNSTEWGSSDEAVQSNYIQKQEQVFSGGNRNPAKTPAVTGATGISSSSTAAMNKFHGVCALLPARSSLQELPFITRFSLGNGKVFRSEGKETFKNKWYSLSSQDFLPTWRWWITTESGSVPADAIECGFTFDDSWYAGSCMIAKGATQQSLVRLFKTNFNVSASDAINFTYKLKNGTESHARLFWAFVGSESTLHYAAIPAAKAQGEWSKFATTASAIGMTGNVAVIGIAYDNTAADYEMLLGEFGIVPNKAYHPAQPKITKADFLERNYNGVNYKLIWDCGQSAATKADASVPTYNDDVDTWYFEVFSQAEGCEPVLDGVTTSWAHYVVGAYATPEIVKYRFGVRAVAPDGKTTTDITWSDWLEKDAEFVEGISVDRPVIKANEEFKVSFVDPLHPTAYKWQIVDASGKDMVPPAKDATGISGKIAAEGTYDVVITETADEETGQGGGGDPATKATQVLGEADIVEGHTYYIYTEGRGGLTVKSASDTRLWGTSEAGVGQEIDNTNVLQHFQFVKQGGKYYLYSVATKKYVSASTSGTLTTSPSSPIYFADKGNNTVRLYFSDVFNINLGGSKQVIIDDWKIKDGGNSFVIMPIEIGQAAEEKQPLIYRGAIQVSTDATGSLPILNDFTATQTTLSIDAPTTAVSFDIARLGEGTVSHGLHLDDGSQFRIPAEVLPASQKSYSVGLWVKPDVFAHSKYGTNLINKRNTERAWPHNNWGAFWVIIWPQWFNSNGKCLLDDNVISYSIYGCTNAGSLDGNSNIHETPFYTCVTDRQHPCGQTYALQPGTWSHVMITYDGTTGQQSIYFNGKRAVTCSTPFSKYDESPIYIGGSNVYHAGIKGTIDDVQVWHKALNEAEVQVAMKGYEGKTVPSELKGYYTFEAVNSAKTFDNLGTAGKSLTGAYINLEGAAGEKTTGTVEVILEPNNNVLGNATLPGSLVVSTTATLTGEGLVGNATPQGGMLKAAGNCTLGLHDVTATLTNMWGSSSITKPNYINVQSVEAIGHVQVDEKAPAVIYNLQGQRVKQMERGVYVVGGKRIVR